MKMPLIQCVIVIYKRAPRESHSLNALLRICVDDPDIARQIELLVHDNSPQRQEIALEAAESQSYVRVEYNHTSQNPGLAYAYNHALTLASARGLPWLLLLDQDTCLTWQFLNELLVTLNQDYAEQPCAVVPQLMQGDLVLSPQFVRGLFYRRMAKGFSGWTPTPVVCFNSAACLSVTDLRSAGGFPPEFWLDYLDHMVFHTLQQKRGRVLVLNSRLEHNLSITDIEQNVSKERYGNILRAEWMFVRRSGWGGGPTVHRLRLLKRSFGHLLRLKNKSYALQTLRSAVS